MYTLYANNNLSIDVISVAKDGLKLLEDNDTKAKEQGYIPVYMSVAIRSTDNNIIAYTEDITSTQRMLCKSTKICSEYPNKLDKPLFDYVLLNAQKVLREITDLDNLSGGEAKLALKTFPQCGQDSYFKVQDEGVHFMCYVIMEENYFHNEYKTQEGYTKMSIYDLDKDTLDPVSKVFLKHFTHVQKGGSANV